MGWSGPVRLHGGPIRHDTAADEVSIRTPCRDFPRAELRFVAAPNAFETHLYGVPMWSLRVEVGAPDDVPLDGLVTQGALHESVRSAVAQVFEAAPWMHPAYVAAKVVESEPLHGALRDEGFGVVERRRLYACRVADLYSSRAPAHSSVVFRTLADLSVSDHGTWRDRIRDLCRQAFASGHSRHFTDPFLLDRLPGVEYILALMEQNFDRIPPERFLMAVAASGDRLGGFSVLGIKPGLEGDTYTQLLSAVRQEYRGQGIYRGLTGLLARTAPPRSVLLNVTHQKNTSIQEAYAGSGRRHLADTVIVRRIWREAR